MLACHSEEWSDEESGVGFVSTPNIVDGAPAVESGHFVEAFGWK